MAERESPKRRFSQKTAEFHRFTLLLEIQAFGGRRRLQKTADFRRKPQIGLRHLRSVTFSSALNYFRIRFRDLRRPGLSDSYFSKV